MPDLSVIPEPPTLVGRLAPSPTGALHIGNARSFLLAWLSLRSRGGKVFLRIEDIDSPRVKPTATAQVIEDLQWMGLDWDEGPIVQTKRLDRYDAALQKLKLDQIVYPCTCSRSDIEHAAAAPHAEHEGAAYPGICSHRRAEDAIGLAPPFAWRFRVRHSPAFEDGFCGSTRVDLRLHGGDYVVWKTTDTPAYQLAVVVDDAAMHVTEVLRGDDLIPSTPRQLLLYEALNLQAPRFVHVPLVVGEDGRRLAKRHGDTRLQTLRAQGLRVETLLGYLAWSCGWLERITPITLRELIPLFRLDTVPKRSFVWREQDLL